MTYLGPALIERVTEPRLDAVSLARAEHYGNGYIVTAYDNPKLIGSTDAWARERAVIRHLGEHNFFDPPARPMRRARYGSRTQRYAEENRRKPTPAVAHLAKVLEGLHGGQWRGQFIRE
jgi:hypothetical protein